MSSSFLLYFKTKKFRDECAHDGMVSSYWTEEKTLECFANVKNFVSSLPGRIETKRARDKFYTELDSNKEKLENLFRGQNMEN